MTSHSPDCFHQTRVLNSNMKASNYNLQSREYNTHCRTVNEYQIDILQHLLNMEGKMLPNLSLIQQQPEINLKMRPLLLDFLMDVTNKLNLSKSTFPLTVNLIDRYCSIRIVKKQHYQLLGLTSLWISCKNLDSKHKIPSLFDLCKMCCNCYDKKLFLEMENHLLKSLNWLVDAPTFDSFIDLFLNFSVSSLNLAGSNIKKFLNDLKILSIYICELIQFYPNIYFNYKSSQIALYAYIASLLVLEIPVNLNQYLSFFNNLGEKDILSADTFSALFQSLLKILKCPPPSLKLKYFNENGKYIHLMKLLINFCHKYNEPVTPQASTVRLPPTPVSSSVSPKDALPERPPIAASPSYDSTIHPPQILAKKRSFLEEDKGSKGGTLKRSKSMKTMFYIS